MIHLEVGSDFEYRTGVVSVQQQRVGGYQQETEEQRAQRIVRQQQAAAEHEQERAHSRVRARKLLTDMLNDEQRETLEKDKFFVVLTPDGKRRYKIRQGYSRNVDLIDVSGKRIHTYCARGNDTRLPDEDHMLAQMLMLMTDEQRFLQIANRS